MRPLLIALALFSLDGCSLFRHGQSKEREDANAEVALTDFSMVITGYYREAGRKIPADFGEAAFFRILSEKYPDKARVEKVKSDYRIRVRALREGLYDVILCDPTGDRKLVEDLSCTLLAVDARHWDDAVASPCEFQPDLEANCK